MSKILVVDDDSNIRELARVFLKNEGYDVYETSDGVEALSKLETTPVDLVVLDIMMPNMDGWELCRQLKDLYDFPVLMLTAKGETSQKLKGFELGTDDYLVKPFALEELRARLRALLRRESSNRGSMLEVDSLTLEPATHFVKRDGNPVELTSKEYALLEYMMRNPNRLITREMAESHVWSYDYDGASNVVDVYIRRLRRKIDDPYPRKLIETVRGAGYRLRAQAG